MNNYVAIMGTKGGPAIRPHSSMPTSLLLRLDGENIVIDCGLGVTRGLVDQGIELKTLAKIFISHLHSDHYLELGPLLHTAWVAGLSTPVDIWGPQGLEDYWQYFLSAMKADIDLRIEDEDRPDLAKLVRVHLIDAGEVMHNEHIKVSAMRTEHPPLVDCFAFSFRSAHHHIVYSGDTAPLPALVDFAHGADLLIHEAMLKEAIPALVTRVSKGNKKLRLHIERAHSSAQDVAHIAVAAEVRALALVHLIPADDPHFSDRHWLQAVEDIWDGPLHIGKDGMRIAV